MKLYQLALLSVTSTLSVLFVALVAFIVLMPPTRPAQSAAPVVQVFTEKCDKGTDDYADEPMPAMAINTEFNV